MKTIDGVIASGGGAGGSASLTASDMPVSVPYLLMKMTFPSDAAVWYGPGSLLHRPSGGARGVHPCPSPEMSRIQPIFGSIFSGLFPSVCSLL